jgi:DNA-binding transcriptional MerR regulator
LDKAPDAYRTISEVADDLDLPQHVLRFWETKFSQIKPLKRGGGRRYYRPDDVWLLRGIKHLLYGEGYTIKGVQRIIREQGARAVVAQVRGEPASTRVRAAPRPMPEPDFDGDDGEGFAEASRHEPDFAAAPREAFAPQAQAAQPAPQAQAPRFAPVVEPPAGQAKPSDLARDDVRRLQAALYELTECKRILDQAR